MRPVDAKFLGAEGLQLAQNRISHINLGTYGITRGSIYDTSNYQNRKIFDHLFISTHSGCPVHIRSDTVDLQPSVLAFIIAIKDRREPSLQT
jgi:hypothetical protein